MDIGINIYSYLNGEKTSDERRCELMAKHGFKYTFCMSDTPFACEYGVKLLSKYGMKFDNLHAPFKDTNAIWNDTDIGERILSGLLYGVDKCSNLGIPTLVVHLTNAGLTPHLSQLGFSRFDRLYEYAKNKNVTLAYENIGSTRVLEKMFERHENAKFCYDSGHEKCFGFYRDFLSRFGDRLITTHIQDNRYLPFLDDHRLPFDARINFDKVARKIARTNYTGVLMLEVLSSKSKMYKGMSAEEYYKRAAERAKILADKIEQYKHTEKTES